MTTTQTAPSTVPNISVADIRKSFLDFYAAKGHTVVASSGLVPGNDPTLMFTNSGMVQFKDVFLGTDKRSYVRAASVQACLRAGGKHNDLENVGYTARHHTFFEMMGNWSFGDYFKRESLLWGWELLTKVYKLPPEKLLATVYIDDQEAYDIWHNEIGLPADRIVRIGDNKGKKYASDNFWMMADTGPCGPCSEIFYDHGAHIEGGPPGSPGEDGDRFIEIWNHVFMQFDMQADGSMVKLPAPCVDTGMGLERLAAILQHVHSNYEIDIFDALIKAASRETGCTDLDNKSLRVIADHIRATAFLVSDGVNPSNEGRGYVQRRIIRRAIRHGYKLGKKTPFFHKLVPDLVAMMGDAYPRLKADGARVMDVLRVEEERFFETLEIGMRILDSALDPAETEARNYANKYHYALEDSWDTSVAVKSTGMYALNSPEIRQEGLLYVKNFESADVAIASLKKTIPDLIQRVKNSSRAPTNQNLRVLGVVPSMSDQQIVDFESFTGLHSMNMGGSFDSSLVVQTDLKSVNGNWVLSGEIAFKLHDTYGFPLDLTQDVCRERDVSVDEASFNLAMDKQKNQARAAGKFKMDKALDYTGAGHPFTGYTQLEESAQVVALYLDGVAVQSLNAGQNGVVVLSTTPFYAESGGQVGDEGLLSAGSPSPQPSPQRGEGVIQGTSLPLPLRGEGRGEGTVFAVLDTQKIKADVFGHHGYMHSGVLKVGDAVNAKVNAEARGRTIRNHSATHLMHKALREVLGTHVQQKGSLVDAEKTRFDFTHNAPVTDTQIREIEAKVNAEILANAATDASEMDLEAAQKTGAVMLFGEKYGDKVRVLSIGSSKELCGGTHVERTGDIGVFKIVSESGVASGVRRVEAVTGTAALGYLQSLEATVGAAAASLKASPSELQNRIDHVLDNVKTLEKEVAALKGKLASSQGDELMLQAVDVKGIKVLAAKLEGADAKTLRDTMDKLKDKLKSAVIVLAAVDGDKVQIAAGVTNDSVGKVKAGELVNFVAQQVGGKGGGKADMAMAGGTDASKLAVALKSVQAWVTERVQ